MECIDTLLAAYSRIVHIFLCLRLFERLELNANRITWLFSNILNVYCTSHYFLFFVTFLEHVHFCGMSLMMHFDPWWFVKEKLALHHCVMSWFLSVSWELAVYIMRAMQCCIVPHNSSLAAVILLIHKMQNANLSTT